MANPKRAFAALLKLVQEPKENDVNMLATFCIELERTVVNPLQARVEAMERRVKSLEEQLGENDS